MYYAHTQSEAEALDLTLLRSVFYSVPWKATPFIRY